MILSKKEGVGMEKTPFLNFFYARRRPPHPQLAPYTPEVETQAPAHPDRLHITGSSAGHARHGAPTHTPGRWTRCTGLHPIPDRPRGADQDGGRRWMACNPSIMCIMIALSQAWYIDSNMNKYHKDILLFLVIVNYYLSIDILSY